MLANCPTLLPPYLVLLLGEALVAAVDGRDEQQGAGQGDDGDDQGRAELVLDGHVLHHFVRGDVDDAELPRKGQVRLLCHPPPIGEHPWGSCAVTRDPLTSSNLSFFSFSPMRTSPESKGTGGRKRLQ